MTNSRDAIGALVDALLVIRSEWIRSDEVMIEMLSNGWSSGQGGYEIVMKEERSVIYATVKSLQNILIPKASFFLDQSLRDQVRKLVSDLNPDSYFDDPFGDSGLRWRRTWDHLGYQSQIDDLVPLLMALALQPEEPNPISETTANSVNAPDYDTKPISRWTTNLLCEHLERQRTTIRKWAVESKLESRKRGQPYTFDEMSLLSQAASKLSDQKSANTLRELVNKSTQP